MKMKKILVICISVFAVFLLMSKPQRCSADIKKDSCAKNSCNIGDSCYPDPGFQCVFVGTGGSCSTWYNCNIPE